MAENVQKAILNTLKALPKADARAYAKQVADLHKSGLTRIRVFPKGIPVVDGVDVTAVLDRKDLDKLLPRLISQLPASGAVQVFPYGIPAPELFGVKIELK